MKVQGIVAIAVVAVAIAACGGGGGGGGTAPGGSSGVLPTAAANATATPSSAALPAGYAYDNVTITMAKGTYSTTSVRRAQTVGAGTESIVFTLLQQNGVAVSGAVQTFGLVQTSPGCTLNANQALTCVLPVDAPIGQDVFLAQTFDNVNGTGNLTGSGAVALSVGQNTTNTASIVLNAQVASAYVVAGSFYLGDYNDDSAARRGGQAATRAAAAARRGTLQTTVNSTPVFVVAVDSSGNTILNPSSYNAPIYLQLGFSLWGGESSYYDGVPGTADVTLSVTYANNDPSPCTGGTATISNWYQSFPICSPGDNVTASLSATGGTNPSYYAYIYADLLSSQLQPTPAPSQSPAAFATPSNNSYAEIYVIYPTPSPTPSGGSISVGVQ